MSLNQTLEKLNIQFAETERKMPTLFVGHGSPLNAIEENEFSRAWMQVGEALPRPTAILCVSAHWETRGTFVTAMEHPKTIHDFGGFPRALYEYQYPAPGSPALARLTQETAEVKIGLDQTWGLDRGTCRFCAGCFRARIFRSSNLALIKRKRRRFTMRLAKNCARCEAKGS